MANHGPDERLSRNGAELSLSLVVPLFNEAARFPEHADELVKFVQSFGPGSELILVDDGSEDSTVRVVGAFLEREPGALPVRLLRRPHRGKGAAVRTGLEMASAAFAGFCDVDLSTPLTDVARLADAAARGGGLAIASRGLSESLLVRRQNRSRERLGRAYNVLLRRTVIDGISDTQCGAKVAPCAFWWRVLPHSREAGMAWDVEIIAIAQRLGLPVQEVAVSWSHDARSRVRTAREGTRMLRAVPRIKRRVRALPRRGIERDEVFDAERAQTLEEGAGHWWFRSKAAFVSEMIEQCRPAGQRRRLIDLGSGSGYTATALSGIGSRFGVEGSDELARSARAEYGLSVAVGRLACSPVRDASADVVILLDVIEHLDDPGDTLREARRILRPGGHVIVTVPAHTWLWSQADEFLGHRRRYTRRLLADDLRASGFDVQRTTHVFSWLTLPVWFRRRVSGDVDSQLGLSTNSPAIDRMARLLTAIERQVIRRVSLPMGTSIVGVGRTR